MNVGPAGTAIVLSMDELSKANLCRLTQHCSNDVQIAMSSHGDIQPQCSGPGRKKSLCCNPPDGVDPISPVALENIFPELPPADANVRFDLQRLGSDRLKDTLAPGGDPNLQAFGFVLIAGPKEVVSSFNYKRDGSHVEVVDCSSISAAGIQKVRILCTNDSEDSNCDDVLDGGLKGTVVRMPDGCGPGQYAIAHSISQSSDQRLHADLEERRAGFRPVMDFEFSYDFANIKRSESPVLLRVDYS